MSRFWTFVAALAFGAVPALAQGTPEESRCLTPDSIAVEGLKRATREQVLTSAGIQAGQTLSFPIIQRVIKDVFATGQFDGVEVTCRLPQPGKALLVLSVVERPVLDHIEVAGTNRIAERTVRDKIDLLYSRALDPAGVAAVVFRIDSLYEAAGYYLAKVQPETTVVADGHVALTFRIDEGRRLAVSGVRVTGLTHVKAADVVGAMKVRPEGFFFWKKGEFKEEEYAKDLSERLPELFQRRGYVDFEITKDTLLIDREKGKALVDLTVTEGPRYQVGGFDVSGNRRFNNEEIRRFYPFGGEGPTLTQRVTGLLRRRETAPKGVFDQKAWEDATQKVRTAYSNEGYIYSQVRPVVERLPADTSAPGAAPKVNLRWDVVENNPAIINRIEIQGNDYTSEACIREQLLVIPGDVFNQDRLIRSWQSIGNLNFFNTPLAPPDTRQANENGDVDVIFKVTEKRTGNVNFGASMGQGVGVGGFIGLDQPNLFGQCKRAQVQWQFGRFINDFNVAYTDPGIRGGRLSGTVNLYRSQARFTVGNLGQNIRTGGNLRVGFPVPYSRFARLFVSYGAEKVRFGSQGLLGNFNVVNCDNCFRSNVGLDFTHDTRIDQPFPSAGSLRNLSAQFNGGILGGTNTFQRYTGEFRSYTTLGMLGGKKPGSQPLKLVAGLSTKMGTVIGDPGPFFFTQQFAMGGVQFGEPLRGYPEFSITPRGFLSNTSTFNAQRESFGSAYFSSTAEVGLRFNQQFYTSWFFDAGNVWQRTRDFNPTRLFRGTGLGISTITPLGPLGLDWALGLDRTDALGRRAPKWQLHFRLGQLF